MPFYVASIDGPGQIEVDDDNNRIVVQFTPTIPHCSMATLIGLCIRVRLLRCLPPRFKVRHSIIVLTTQVTVEIFPDTHVSRDAGMKFM